VVWQIAQQGERLPEKTTDFYPKPASGLMMLDIARSASAKEVHAIIPYFSFSRSDKKDAPRISITARLVADLLATAGATHVMTMVLHSPQVHGFFSIPADPLTSRQVFQQFFKDNKRNAGYI
jgi:ribose-phosphate pyrophosphokinase